jgi:hypothetical protein
MLALAVGGLIGGTRVVVEATDTDDALGSSALVSTAGASPSNHPSRPMPQKAPAQRSPSVNVYAATEHGRSPAVAGDPERVYVPNSKSGSVDVINPETFRIVAHFSVAATQSTSRRRGTFVGSTSTTHTATRSRWSIPAPAAPLDG